MSFEELLYRAKASDKKARMEVVEMYRPLLLKNAMVNGRFDEDLYQECVYTLLLCIMRFNGRKDMS